MSRSGLSIRKLITSRRLSDEDLDRAELKKTDSIPTSWMEQDGTGSIYAPSRSPRPSSRRKQTPAPIIATSPLTHSDILRPLPPLPNETPRSSASSSCRCERHIECDCPLLSWKRRSPDYSVSLYEGSEDKQLLSCLNIDNPDDSLARHIPKSRFYLADESQGKRETDRALSPEARHIEVGTKGRTSSETPPQELSDNLQKFMQETEDAFKAIGNTFGEELESPPPPPPPKEKPTGKRPPAKEQPVPDSTPKPLPKVNIPPQKPKMKRPKKSRQSRAIRSARKSITPKQAAKIVPRWTLTENVSELLMGKLFHRVVEPDEMLTPEQIEAYKQQREKMAEALEQEPATTPTEPFYLDEPALRTGTASGQIGMEAPVEEKPANSLPEDATWRDFPGDQQQNTDAPPIPPRQRPPIPINKAAPTTSRHIRSSSRKLVTDLPSIPEVGTTPRTTPRTSDELYSSNESSESLESPNSASEYVYLQSPYSLTTPAIRHGPIRLSKYDLLPDMKFGGDEGLDWTAFQMAILGGAGDLFPDRGDEEMLRRIEAEELADITAWWDSWHFENAGELVEEKYEPVPSPTSSLSGDEVPDLSYSEIESDNSHSPEHKGRATHHHHHHHHHRKSRAPSLQLDLDFTSRGKKHRSSHYLADARGPLAVAISDAWQQDSNSEHQTQPQLQPQEQHKAVTAVAVADMHRDREGESVGIGDSLPPSPMLDLRVIRSDNGDDMDVVPMGYNLGHDLGDFLKWEAEHAYAGDFRSPL